MPNSLLLEERGTSGDLSDLIVVCTGCEARRPVTQARTFADDAAPLGYCRGERPWLGVNAREECVGKGGKPFPNRLLIRTASNAYFAQVLSVIHIPDRDQALRAAVDVVWSAHLKSIPSLEIVMLHSLSHLLITAVSLECGYGASAISERIYVGEQGLGILLYTGSAHSEGTLGGLVEVGRHLDTHLKNALERGRLCSNDPVCAQHKPDSTHEARYLHGAACHGCLLIAETSCERQNQLLDRSLVVPTVDASTWALFPELP